MNQYQKLLEKIINECNESLVWTCKYPPKEWFDKVYLNEEGTNYREQKQYDKLRLDHMPLLCKFSLCRAQQIRLVNMNKKDFYIVTGEKFKGKRKNPDEIQKYIEDEYKFLSYFINVNNYQLHDCELIFVDPEKITESIRGMIQEKDIGIYDNLVNIEFIDDPNNKDVGKIKLTLDHPLSDFVDDVKKYVLNKEGHGLIGAHELLKRIKNYTNIDVTEKYFEFTGKRLNKKDINHINS